MNEPTEIPGPALVSWLANQAPDTLALLVGLEYADDDDVWSIAGVDGASVILRAQDDARPRRCHFQVLAAGTVYAACDHPLPARYQADRSPFDQMADQAREFLRHDSPCRNASLADTEAVTLHRLLNTWRANAGVPSLEQVDELLQWFRRERPVSRQACDLLRDWEAAIARSPVRVAEQPEWLVRLLRLLRDAGQAREAATRVHELGSPAGWRFTEAQQLALLVEHAGALMDLHEQASDRAYLDRAHRLLRMAWARQRPSEPVSRAFNRHEALMARLEGSATGA